MLESFIAYPADLKHAKAPQEVPTALAGDFNEAASVLPISAKASAALSRRCLQGLLRDQGFNHHNLGNAIQAAIEAKTFPHHLVQNLDAVRTIGNFAAHPMKDTNTGEVLPVEDHEAEWNLEVLQGLFDFCYVQPAASKAKRDALNAKLQTAGKPPMKQ